MAAEQSAARSEAAAAAAEEAQAAARAEAAPRCPARESPLFTHSLALTLSRSRLRGFRWAAIGTRKLGAWARNAGNGACFFVVASQTKRALVALAASEARALGGEGAAAACEQQREREQRA